MQTLKYKDEHTFAHFTNLLARNVIEELLILILPVVLAFLVSTDVIHTCDKKMIKALQFTKN